jgi:hypothetical protein
LPSRSHERRGQFIEFRIEIYDCCQQRANTL